MKLPALALAAIILPQLALAANARLAWDPSPSPSSQVAGYRVYYGAASGKYSNQLDAGNTTTFTVPKLTVGTTYYFSVTAYGPNGEESDFSNEVSKTVQPEDITTGLVAAYAFDEGTGSISTDLSGSGNIAFIYSAGWAQGKYGNALSFNGTDSCAFAGGSGLPDANHPQTISFWFYATARSASAQSMLAMANSALKASLRYSGASALAGLMGAGDNWLLFSPPPSLNAWHHFGYVFDGSQNLLYIDGVLVGASTIAPSAASAQNLQIGCSPDGSEYFQGSIDEIRIYSRALTADQLSAAMDTPLSAGAANTNPDAQNPSSQMTPTDPTTGNPLVNLSLEGWIYAPGEVVNASSLWMSNPSQQDREVELKVWMEFPGLLPISVNNWSPNGMFSLPPQSSMDYGAMPLLQIGYNAPVGIIPVNTRLIDPATGDVLSEDFIPSFILTSRNNSNSFRVSPPAAPNIILESATDGFQVYYTVTNQGTGSAAVELKVWLEATGYDPFPVLIAGEDQSLILPVGASLSFYPNAGTSLLKARILNPATGDPLFKTLGQ